MPWPALCPRTRGLANVAPSPASFHPSLPCSLCPRQEAIGAGGERTLAYYPSPSAWLSPAHRVTGGKSPSGWGPGPGPRGCPGPQPGPECEDTVARGCPDPECGREGCRACLGTGSPWAVPAPPLPQRGHRLTLGTSMASPWSHCRAKATKPQEADAQADTTRLVGVTGMAVPLLHTRETTGATEGCRPWASAARSHTPA